MAHFNDWLSEIHRAMASAGTAEERLANVQQVLNQLPFTADSEDGSTAPFTVGDVAAHYNTLNDVYTAQERLLEKLDSQHAEARASIHRLRDALANAMEPVEYAVSDSGVSEIPTDHHKGRYSAAALANKKQFSL